MIVLIGLALVVAGVAFKLNQLMGAEMLFNAGAILLVLGLLIWAIALLRRRT
ncbi:MAG: hypothetical protein ACO3MV_09400 [Flavobacteriales bacterium]